MGRGFTRFFHLFLYLSIITRENAYAMGIILRLIRDNDCPQAWLCAGIDGNMVAVRRIPSMKGGYALKTDVQGGMLNGRKTETSCRLCTCFD